MPLPQQIIAQTLDTDLGKRAYAVVETLTDAGHDTWWVGGCVRDMLEGKIPHDIDIATSAKPEQILKLFARAKGEGEQFGSTRVLQGDSEFEVTTFREDDEASDGRHPESVVFGTREQDGRRRDFTVNALYFQPISRELYDPFGGESDLKERLIRFIGEPALRIRHDALRILRAVRFRALIDGQYHPETYTALREQIAVIDVLSGERILSELSKMLLGPHPERAFEDLWEIGALKQLIPELDACKGIPQPKDYHHEGDVWDHTLQCLKSFEPEHGIDVRIATLFHDSGKVETFSLTRSTGSGQATRIRFDHHASISGDIVSAVLKRLQVSKKRIQKIDWLVRHHMSMTFLDMTEDRKSHWYHHPWFTELLQLFWLDIAGTTPANYTLYEQIIADYHRYLDQNPTPKKPLLKGDEVMEILGLKTGAEVGEVLKELETLQRQKKITTKKEAREHLLREIKIEQ